MRNTRGMRVRPATREGDTMLGCGLWHPGTVRDESATPSPGYPRGRGLSTLVHEDRRFPAGA